VSLDDVRRALCERIGFEPAVVSLEPNRLSDLWSDIRRVGEALGVRNRADALIETLQQRMSDVAIAAGRANGRPTVACIEWIDPLMVTGNWMPELIEMAGGTNLFGQAGQRSPTMSWEELAAADPEIIVIMPCGFSIGRALREMHMLKRKDGWDRLRAVRAGRVFVADGNQYFNRPGPRLAESLEILAEIFHPDLFRFGREGAGWVRYQGEQNG
jgi:iron complex transport system substrate-binding protein